LLGFTVAGHDTTSTTFSWAVKLISDNERVQGRLRSALREAFPKAIEEKRLPSADEMIQASIPYLDAVEEEIFRTALTTPAIIRTATTDTTVLGHFIPEGTDVFLLNNGPSMLEPAFDIPDSQRSDSSLKSKTLPAWNSDNIGEFAPERWLVEEGGKETFSSTAGPQMLFGAGPRGCYGRKLAHLQLRFLITMIVWSFDMRSAGEKLSSYAAIDGMTRRPKQCYLNLAVLG
jgi:cytochrome P450